MIKWPKPTHDSFQARMERLLHTNYSWCLRCGRPWLKVEHHTTYFSECRGMFPLCETCWQLLASPEARVEYYRTLVEVWEPGSLTDVERHELARAVANGG